MRERVVGVETEYALIYHPGRGERRRPRNLELYTRFEAALRRRVHTLPNAFSPLRGKLGRFLENGGTFHYESTLEDYEHGLIEMASPECRDPLCLVRYEKAKDALLEDLTEEVAAQLALLGYTGRLRVGKNNVDSQGHSFGSHENYWVDDPLPRGRRRVFALLWLVLWLLTVPVVGLLLWLQLLFLRAWLVATCALPAVEALLSQIGGRLRGARTRRWLGRVRRADAFLQGEPIEIARRLQFLTLPLHAMLWLHGFVYGRFHFQPIQRHATAFLVTRCIYAGSGAVSFDGGPLYRISQRAPFIRELTRICVEGKRRPIFETRDLFFRPWAALGRRRRLQLFLGDSNLCDAALFLRVGATCLVLEAIETGTPHPWPALVDPLGSLLEVSEDVALERKHPLEGGRRASAVQIQRDYLAGVRAVLPPDRLEQGWRARVLAEWERTLDALEAAPGTLADRIDWIAKLRLLRSEVPDDADWAALEERGAELLDVEADGGEDARLRELAYRVWRTDLRYHELSARGGFRRLERRGRVVSLADPEAVAEAVRLPPRDTRAWARGRAIRLAARHAGTGSAAWHRVRLGTFDWRWFPDPLDPRERGARRAARGGAVRGD